LVPFWAVVKPTVNKILGYFVLNLEVYVRVCIFLSSTAMDDTVGKLEPANFVASLY
jgi:hypothetical protein